MKYYSTQRPIGPGTIPQYTENPIKEIKNFDNRIFCEEINREAWGYVEYEKPLSQKEAAEYELAAFSENSEKSLTEEKTLDKAENARPTEEEINNQLLQIIKNYDDIKSRLFIKAAPIGDIKDLPHIKKGNIRLYCAILLFSDDGAVINAPINSQLMGHIENRLHVDFHTLYNDALENSAKIMPPEITLMADFFREQYPTLPTVPFDEVPFYIVTNQKRLYGASALFYGDAMDMCANRLRGGYYILPSSVHETIIIPDSYAKAIGLDELSKTIKSVNSTDVKEKDRLDEVPYHYDPKSKSFELASRYEEKVRAKEQSEEHSIGGFSM